MPHSPLALPPRVKLWQGLMCLAALLPVIFCIASLSVVLATWGSGCKGTLGASFEEVQYFSGRHTYTIKSLSPESPLLAVGAKTGDQVQFDRLGDRAFWDAGGVEVGLRLNSDGRITHHRLRTVLEPADPLVDRMNAFANAVGGLANVAVALLLALRAPRDTASRWLAGYFLMQGFNTLSWAQVGGDLRELQRVLWFLTLAIGNYALLPFALNFADAGRLALQPLVQALHRAFQLLTLACLSGAVLYVSGRDVPWYAPLHTTQAYLSTAFTCLVLGWGYLRAHGEQRQRLVWLLAGLGLPSLLFIPSYLELDAYRLVVYALGWAASYGSLAILAYAVLRHRLLDLGLAVNRTLVFSATCLLLSLLFFVLQRLTQDLIHYYGIQHHPVLDGLIGGFLFLSFNRVRQRIEGLLSSAFFRRWQQNEAALRRFVSKAPHYTAEPSLIEAYVQELQRFTGGAPVAFYRLADDGRHQRICSSLTQAPTCIDADDDLVVSLKASRDCVALSDTCSEVGGEWALGLTQSASLEGLVLLGARPRGSAYRDDELSQLQLASAQVGSALYDLKVRRLQEQIRQLTRGRDSAAPLS